MIKERHLHAVASFLIVLILTIPFYTTSVYATINSITVKGSNNIEGFAKSNDFLNFNVQVSIGNDTITKDQVVIGSNTQFDKCELSQNNLTECTLRFPSSGTELFESKSIPFTVNLYTDDKTLDDSKSSSVVIDNKPPQVKLSVPQNTFTSQENVVINYEVTDTACDDASCSGKCVGISSVEFYTLDGKFKQTIDAANNSNECSLQSTLNIESNKFSNGQNSVFAKASDKFNLVSAETSVTFSVSAGSSNVTSTNASNETITTVDNTSTSTPNLEILTDSFVIIRKGMSINTFPPRNLPVEVFVNISGSLNTNSVAADLSALNPNSNLKNVKASCTSIQTDLYKCKWSMELNPGTSGVKTITINAQDTAGNKISSTLTKDLSLDDKGPVVQSLSTGTTLDGKIYGKASGNTVFAVFDEASGLSADEVILNIGSSKLKAKSCNKESGWACIWENINFASSGKISIGTDTKDILGNAVSKEFSSDVVVDSKAPVLKSINISSVGGITQAFSGIFKVGDKISVVANLTEKNDLIAVADFSIFVTDASRVAGTCQRIEDEEQVCTWLTEAIDKQATGNIKFNFSDPAGNSLIVTQTLKTYGLDETAQPDYWTNKVSCSPKTIDRQLGPLINQRVFCQVKLEPKVAKPVSTVFVGQASCKDDKSIIEQVETFNTETATKSPIIKLTLKKSDFKINNANITCSFDIFSKIDDSITKNPEVEKANINIEFYNLPLGELSKEIEDKIDDAKKDAEGIWKIIGTLNKLVFYAKKICQIIHTIYNVLALLHNIVFIVTGSQIVLEKIPFVAPIAKAVLEPLSVGNCKTETNLRQVTQKTHEDIVNKFCAYVTCKETFLWGPAVKNFVDSLPGAQYVGGYSNKMKPENNLIVATLFVCLPGIVYGLDKYRQIKCLYADCLQNAVGKEGLPVTACEDQKAYATCKYVTGEIFAVVPWTAVFDHFMGLIKNSLSNPFAALGAAISFACGYTCPTQPPETRLTLYGACETLRLFNQLGSIASDVKNMIDEGFKIRTDYCSRLK